MAELSFPLAAQIRENLRSGRRTREELLDWYKQFEAQFSVAERAQLRDALGLERRLIESPFRELVPEGWFHDVLELVKEGESPSSFYFLAALTVLSQAVGRQVMVDRGTHQLGLDCSALLISPAGKGRRSTACDFVVYELAAPAGLNIIADSFSYEAFGDELVNCAGLSKLPANRIVEGARALIYAGEMSVLLGKGSYGESIIPKLTDMLGKTSRFEWRTVKRGGKIIFKRPMVNALLTSAPDWLVENIPTVVFGGGMLSRFLMSVQDRPEQVVTWGKPIDDVALKACIERLRAAGTSKGLVEKPTGAAFEWYDTWYQRHTAQYLDGEILDVRMEPYYSRKHDHLLRMATLLCIAANMPPKFTVERFEQALRIIEWLEVGIPKAYASMALSPVAAAQRAVCEVLVKAGGRMEHAKLQKRVYRLMPLAEQFKVVMNSLADMGIVKVVSSPFSKRGRSYVLVKELD